jgi:hypothetical protein
MNKLEIPLMIDSGAFSAWKQRKPLDLDEYIDFIKEKVAMHDNVVYFNLDVIPQKDEAKDGAPSYRNFLKMKRAGLNPIPVYHGSTDIKWLKRYMSHTDFIALGWLVGRSSPALIRMLDHLWDEHLTDDKGMPLVKVHGLGVTSFVRLKRYPWYSVDSTTWLQAAIYGKVFIPHLRKGEWDYDNPPYVITMSSRSSKVSVKDAHLLTLSPKKEKIIRKFLDHVGIPFGKSKTVEGEEVAVVPGVSNDYELRGALNAYVFNKFVMGLEWPRPFAVRRPKGFVV